jgi:hypothetical protein
MDHHPVRFHVDRTSMGRAHVLVRAVLLCALATVGWPSGYWLLYLVLPAVTAALLSRDGPARFFGDDAPRTVHVLRWFAGVYAYLWLLTDELPRLREPGPVVLDVEVCGTPSLASALARLVTSLPAALFLALLSALAAPLWVFGAVSILAVGRVPAFVHDFLSMKLAYQFRLVAYHLSLVDAYPSLGDPQGRAETAAHSI